MRVWRWRTVKRNGSRVEFTRGRERGAAGLIYIVESSRVELAREIDSGRGLDCVVGSREVLGEAADSTVGHWSMYGCGRPRGRE